MSSGSRSPVLVLFALIVLATALPVHAERLAIRRYTTADGLPSNDVRVLLHDSAGALWVGTEEGLSRFDGQSFRTFGPAEGLPHASVQALVESRGGFLWVGTAGGLAYLPLRGEGATRFTRLALVSRSPAGGTDPGVLSLAEAIDGRVWVGTTDGLFSLSRASRPGSDWTVSRHEIPFDPRGGNLINRRFVRALLPDADGALWVGASSGVYRCDANVRCVGAERFETLPASVIHALGRDRQGRVWAGGRAQGIAALIPHEPRETSHPTPFESRLRRDVLPYSWVLQLASDQDGTLWAATYAGLCVLDIDDSGEPSRRVCLGRANGFPSDEFQAVAFAAHGVVFTADPSQGLVRWDRRGAVTFADEPGMPRARIETFARTRDGRWVGLTQATPPLLIERHGTSFTTTRLNLPAGWATSWWPGAIQDRDRRWWVAANRGVCIYPPASDGRRVEGLHPERCLGVRDGLPDDGVFGLHEDGNGDIWIASQRDHPPALARWRRETQRLEFFGPGTGLPECHFLRGFVEDRAGDLWIGCYAGGLVRFRSGRFERFDRPLGPETGAAVSLLVDQNGRLWAGFDSSGIARCDDPSAEEPRFVRVGVEDGLPSAGGGTLAMDHDGHVYVANTQGVFRIRDAQARPRHFGLEDGLPSLSTRDILCDAEGALWVATTEGVARLVPQRDVETPPPDPVVSQLRAGGIPAELPLLGRARVSGIELPSERGTVEVGVAATALESGERLRFQYRLTGLESEFGAVTDDATRLYPSLSPGKYQVEVRTVGASGLTSAGVASVSVRVLAPWWQREWFLALAGALVAALAYAAHRLGLQRRLALERMRIRIATDLHDDLGSSLSSIAIQSEVLGRTASGLSADERARLRRIGASAAEMVETMSDIVWAVNPRFDRLSQLAHRMHRFARETLDPAGIRVSFDDRSGLDDIPLDSAVRRQLYLVFKELMHNVVRHAAATRVDVVIETVRNAVLISVTDDGLGFDVDTDRGHGLGLASMRRRAASIGAALDLRSQPGQGTATRITLPR